MPAAESRELGVQPLEPIERHRRAEIECRHRRVADAAGVGRLNCGEKASLKLRRFHLRSLSGVGRPSTSRAYSLLEEVQSVSEIVVRDLRTSLSLSDDPFPRRL